MMKFFWFRKFSDFGLDDDDVSHVLKPVEFVRHATTPHSPFFFFPKPCVCVSEDIYCMRVHTLTRVYQKPYIRDLRSSATVRCQWSLLVRS